MEPNNEFINYNTEVIEPLLNGVIALQEKIDKTFNEDFEIGTPLTFDVISKGTN
jgi:hypothetical protein